jgi:phospholipid-binding lipoprotein MlaA
MKNNKLITRIAGFLWVFFLVGCATTAKDREDPWEGWNRGAQTFNDNLDDYIMKPIAEGYQFVMPSFADRGVSNFFSNINDIAVTLNDLLQLKFAQGGKDGARFLVNSVAGVAGFIDVADMIDLPKHNEDFDQTLGVWGAPTGPYLVLPFFGPSSSRGVGGMIGDAAMNPLSYFGFFGSGAISTSLFGVNTVDLRADNLSTEKIATEAALDRYEFFKNAYLQQREYLVHDGNIPFDEEYEEFHLDEEGREKENLGPVAPY